jgi:hypothetical protein
MFRQILTVAMDYNEYKDRIYRLVSSPNRQLKKHLI